MRIDWLNGVYTVGITDAHYNSEVYDKAALDKLFQDFRW